MADPMRKSNPKRKQARKTRESGSVAICIALLPSIQLEKQCPFTYTLISVKNTILSVPIFFIWGMYMCQAFQFFDWLIQKLIKDSQVPPWMFNRTQVPEKSINLRLSEPFRCTGNQPSFKTAGAILHIAQEVGAIIRG